MIEEKLIDFKSRTYFSRKSGRTLHSGRKLWKHKIQPNIRDCEHSTYFIHFFNKPYNEFSAQIVWRFKEAFKRLKKDTRPVKRFLRVFYKEIERLSELQLSPDEIKLVKYFDKPEFHIEESRVIELARRIELFEFETILIQNKMSQYFQYNPKTFNTSEMVTYLNLFMVDEFKKEKKQFFVKQSYTWVYGVEVCKSVQTGFENIEGFLFDGLWERSKTKDPIEEDEKAFFPKNKTQKKSKQDTFGSTSKIEIFLQDYLKLYPDFQISEKELTYLRLWEKPDNFESPRSVKLDPKRYKPLQLLDQSNSDEGKNKFKVDLIPEVEPSPQIIKKEIKIEYEDRGNKTSKSTISISLQSVKKEIAESDSCENYYRDEDDYRKENEETRHIILQSVKIEENNTSADNEYYPTSPQLIPTDKDVEPIVFSSDQRLNFESIPNSNILCDTSQNNESSYYNTNPSPNELNLSLEDKKQFDMDFSQFRIDLQQIDSNIPEFSFDFVHPNQNIQNSRDPREVGPGLKNAFQTSYINSILQCLFYTEPFANEIFNHIPNCMNPYCVWCQGFKTISGILFNQAVEVVNPKQIIDWARNQQDIYNQVRFPLGKENDVYEFWHHLRGSLLQTCSKEIYTSCFQGKLKQSVPCSNCSYISPNEQSFFDIPLEVASVTEKKKLEDYLDQVFNVCPHCYCQNKGFKAFSEAPKTLVLHLSKDSANTKKSAKVYIPPSLKLSSLEEENLNYVLYASVCGKLSKKNTHYYSFANINDDDNNSWYKVRS